MAAELGFDYEACFERNPLFKRSDIAELKTWIEALDKPGNIPKDVSDKQLLIFHNACDMKIEDTKKCIISYYTVRDKSPEHFDERDFTSPLMSAAVVAQEYGLLPVLTDEGYNIMFHALQDEAPDKYNFNTVCKLLCMTIDRCLYENGPQNGFIFIFDMKGVRLGHMTRVNLISMSKFFTYIQEGMPVKIIKIHILNVVPFIDKIMGLMKPFMKRDFLHMISLHKPDMDMEKFYDEVLPKRCLPSDFGGDQPDKKTLNKINTERLTALRPYFEAEEKHRNSYSKSKKKAERGFQNLNID